MQNSAGQIKTRARRACDPCRRKKTKCPGERPVCSFCHRLNQRCTYNKESGITKDNDGRKPERSSPYGRIDRLESHVDRIYDLLNNIKDPKSGSRTPSSSIATAQPHLLVNEEFEEPDLDTITSGSETPSRPSQILNARLTADLVDIYRQQIHCQPLALFDPDDLETQIPTWSQHLLLSFIVLARHLSPDLLEDETWSDVRQQSRQTRYELLKRTTDKNVKIDVLQAYCLFILVEIARSDRISAWIDIGIATRLAIAAGLLDSGSPHDDWSRCCCSLFILDRVYGSSFSMVPSFPNEVSLPSYHGSHLSLTTRALNNQRRDSSTPTNLNHQSIDACCMRLLSIWGHTFTFLKSVKDGQCTPMWSRASSYYDIIAELHEFESGLGETHRIRYAPFHEYSSVELESNRGYWAYWLLMHILYHVIHVIINHPVLHIAKKPKGGPQQPPTFLQSTVDLLVLNSGWVVNLINICTDKNFEIHDPFIAHLVSITATAYAFLMHTKDSNLRQQAYTGFDKCYAFVKHISSTWKHLNHMVNKLDVLRGISDQAPRRQPNKPAPAPAFLLWSLFDYSSSTVATGYHETSSGTVEMNVTTQFLSPFASVQTPQPHQVNEDEPMGQVITDRRPDFTSTEFEVDQDSFDNRWDLFDPMLMADIHTSNLDVDFWMESGQL